MSYNIAATYRYTVAYRLYYITGECSGLANSALPVRHNWKLIEEIYNTTAAEQAFIIIIIIIIIIIVIVISSLAVIKHLSKWIELNSIELYFVSFIRYVWVTFCLFPNVTSSFVRYL
jgi:hypothetical protein